MAMFNSYFDITRWYKWAIVINVPVAPLQIPRFRPVVRFSRGLISRRTDGAKAPQSVRGAGVDKMWQNWRENLGRDIIGLVSGNIYRKPWFLPSNIGFSCKFSHHPIL